MLRCLTMRRVFGCWMVAVGVYMFIRIQACICLYVYTCVYMYVCFASTKVQILRLLKATRIVSRNHGSLAALDDCLNRAFIEP
jgi:hypothetical protein